jgi:hypothetical protein
MFHTDENWLSTHIGTVALKSSRDNFELSQYFLYQSAILTPHRHADISFPIN